MPTRIFTFLVLGLTSCKDKAPAGDTGPTTTVDTATEDTGVEETVVWADNRLETSETLTGVYASGLGLYVSATGGNSWIRQQTEWTISPVEVDDEDLNGMWGSGTGADVLLYAAGDAGYIATYSIAGWDTEDLGTPNFEAIDGPNPDALLAVGWGGVYSNISGEWVYESITGNPRFNHVWFNGSWAAAVGEDGAIGVLNSGLWVVTEHESRAALYGVGGPSTTDMYACGESGLVLHWNGNVWTDISPGTTAALWAIYSADAANIFVVGNNGTALHYDGSTWTTLATGVDNNLYAVHGSSSINVWAVGNRGMALNYTGGEEEEEEETTEEE